MGEPFYLIEMKALGLRNVKWPAWVTWLVSNKSHLLILSPDLFPFHYSICLGSLSWAIILVTIVPDAGIIISVKDTDFFLSHKFVSLQPKVSKNPEKAWATYPTYQTKERNGVLSDVVVGQNLRISADSKWHVLEFLHHTMEYGHYWYF